MAITLSEKMRWTAGGKQFRVHEYTHGGGAAGETVTAGSLDLDYIEAVIGVNTNLALGATAASALTTMLDISIGANNGSLVWIGSTSAGYQTITVAGW